MPKRKSTAWLIQGTAMLALFVLTFIGAREAWVVMTMELLFAAISLWRGGRERRAEAEADRRRTARRERAGGLP